MPLKVGSPSRISSSPMSRRVSRLWLRRIRPMGVSARISCSFMVSGMRERGERDLAWTKTVPPAESLTTLSFTSLPSSISRRAAISRSALMVNWDSVVTSTGFRDIISRRKVTEPSVPQQTRRQVGISKLFNFSRKSVFKKTPQVRGLEKKNNRNKKKVRERVFTLLRLLFWHSLCVPLPYIR